MLSETVVVLDFEATGFYWEQGDRVTEVAALRIHGDRITDKSDLVAAHTKLHRVAARIHQEIPQ